MPILPLLPCVDTGGVGVAILVSNQPRVPFLRVGGQGGGRPSPYHAIPTLPVTFLGDPSVDHPSPEVDMTSQSQPVGMGRLPSGSATAGEPCESYAREVIDSGVMDEERSKAIAELIQALPPRDILLRWARENPPPQEWFDEDHDLL